MSSQERTEDPTPRRHEEARSRGQVVQSHDVASATLLLAGFLVLQGASGSAFTQLGTLMRSSFQQMTLKELTPQTVYERSVALELTTLQILAPLFAALLILGTAVSVVQTRFLLTSQPLHPDLSRINPLNGFRRLFSSRSLVELGKALMKATIIGFVVYRAFVDELPRMLALSQTDLRVAMTMLGGSAVGIALKAGVALFVLGAIDYLYQRRQHFSAIRMTKDELREEMKHSEGRPEVRARIRQLQRQLAQGRSLPNVRKADAVVVNPTHYAVAIQYKPTEMQAPKVVAKGKGLIAQQIRRIAAEAGVTIVPNPPLAQTLYRTVEVGQEIPTSLYQAVAELLAFIYSLRRGRIGR